jgi:DMSO/TMAO reductase YedYZ molybdopterin-dependent catalytic subunit
VTAQITPEELQLATRNHGMPLEALRYPVTPVGLHYLLIHYDIPAVDAERFSLTIGGRVDRPLSLTLDQLRDRPSVELAVTMECAGNGRALLAPRPLSQPWLLEAVGTARWRGTPLRPLLEEAGPTGGAVEVLFTGLDRGVEGGAAQSFQRSLPIQEALRHEVLLAYEMNGAPLLPQHGYPLRLIVPGWYGMANVKWLASITVTDVPFHGYQQARAYRLRQDEQDAGEPLTLMLPRALMVPPGDPEFLTRERVLPFRSCTIEGRAWSGYAPIAGVEVSANSGATWNEAQVERADGAWEWSHWWYEWTPPAPGRYELSCRARDEAGNVQPIDQRWNLGGYANNAAQGVAVTVGRQSSADSAAAESALSGVRHNCRENSDERTSTCD